MMQLRITAFLCLVTVVILQASARSDGMAAEGTDCSDFECCEDGDCPAGVHCDVADILSGTGPHGFGAHAEEVGVCVQDDYCNGDLSSEDSEYGWQPGWMMDEQFQGDNYLAYAGGVKLTEDNMLDGCVQQTLPFAFPFFGAPHTSVWVCVEGFLQFTTENPGVDNSNTCPITDEGPRILAFHGNLGFFYYYFKRGGGSLVEDIFYAESMCVNPRSGSLQQCVHFQWAAVTDCEIGVCESSYAFERGPGDWGQFEVDVTLYADGTIGMLVTNRDGTHFSNAYSMGLTSGSGSVIEFVCNDDAMPWQSFLAYPRDSYVLDCLTEPSIFELDFSEASFHWMTSTSKQEERP